MEFPITESVDLND